MDSTFAFIGLVIYILGLLAGLALVPLSLPGIWVIFGSATLYSLFVDFQSGTSDFWALSTLLCMGLLAEGLEFAITFWGGKKYNVSTGAIIASMVGSVIGAIIGFPIVMIGSLIGLLLGVFAGAFVYDLVIQKDPRQALQTAIGAFFSRITALFLKTILALFMVIYILMKTF